jgi:large-conductance mechanosensitive channel
MRVTSGLKQFINDHGFVTVTTGFCVGHAGSALIESLITDVVMRLLNPFLGNNDWMTHELVMGPFSFLWGGVFASALHLATVLWIVIYLIKFFEKSESP